MQIIDTSRSVLENLYYLSGVLILISIVIGLRQLYLTKSTLEINSKREAASLAAKQVEVYTTRIIPLLNKVFFEEQRQKVIHFDVEVDEFKASALIKNMGEEKYQAAILERIKICTIVLEAINAMEAFSVYFIKEVADEEIAFSSVGRTFTKSVESLYFDISCVLADDNDKSFQNLIKLYDMWSKRLKKERLERDKEGLTKQIENIQSLKVKPIGTK